MANDAHSFIRTFQNVYSSAMAKRGDNQWLETYLIQGTECVMVGGISASNSDDKIIIINGIDSYSNRCVVVSRVEMLNIVMRLEERKEGISEPKRIGFDLEDTGQ